MTKGTKAFRIIISILLGLTMLFSAFCFFTIGLHISRDVMGGSYGITVAGVDVTRRNEEDVLGDGSVFYDSYNHMLTFQNAEIAYNDSVVYSKVDLLIQLIGENKFIMSGETVPAIHAANYMVSKDLAIFGDGSLSIEYEGTCTDTLGIFAKDIRIESDISMTLTDSTNISNGLYSEGNLTISNGSTVTVNTYAATFNTAVKVSNNLHIETGSALNVSANPGTADLCRGVTVGGSLVVWEEASLNVSVDDAAAKRSECINVAGLMKIRDAAKVSASAKKAHGIECYGSMELGVDASILASSEREGADLLCYGAIVNHGTDVNGETEALGGIHSK